MTESNCSLPRSPFFQRFPELPLSLEDILPSRGAEPSERTPYAGYLRDLKPSPFDEDASAIRAAALQGQLGDADFESLNQLLERAKSGRPGTDDLFRHFAAIKVLAMQAAQVVFVHHCLSEGLAARVRGFEDLRQRLAAQIRQYESDGEPVSPPAASFYASLFLLQTAFDRSFVPEVPIGRYHYDSGHYRLSSEYRDATRYLDLCAIFEVEAGAAERALCENVTSGWGDGIERPQWDRLNELYYQGKSPFSGRPNLFATHYDHLLERMLPQFAYSKVRLADTVVAGFQAGRTVRLLEFGAGSGAFAIDLLMALKRRGRSAGEIEYLGLEPSQAMIAGFTHNIRSKLGRDVDLQGWQLRPGSLEEAHQQIGELCAGQHQETVGVFSFSPHHIHQRSLRAFLTSRQVRRHLSRIYVLEGTERHGWTKMLYMWADCESPENFRNVLESGKWTSRTLWEEPSEPVAEYPYITNAWCRARLLT